MDAVVWLLFATTPFFAAILGWVLLVEPVMPATWIAIYMEEIDHDT
jgi:drug/metabolite transporter (DMT)-like permease